MTETETKWAERIEQWKESGQKAAEFASGQPYKASTLVWWSTELRRRAEGRVRQAKPRGVRNKIPLARVVPVRRPRSTSTVHEGRSRIVVEVSGARISLERGFDAELLGEVVRVLGGTR